MKDGCHVFSQLVALAGSSAVVYNVIDYLNATLDHIPAANEIADEIVKRRERVQARINLTLGVA